ncbi:MAG: hypothetical protein H7247_15045 [Polaromonas sp.]|nr:hypothetical protein [Gemmatimonadaceae bacterium]
MTSRVLLLALMLTGAAAPQPDAPVKESAGRPVILIVHGRGFLSRDSAAFRRKALHALREGAFRASGDSLLDDDDVRLVWYADLMAARRGARSVMLCDGPADTADVGLSPGFLLRSLALVASELVDAGATDSVADDARDLAGDLRFVGDPSMRCDAEGRVANALSRAHREGRPVILVAHSLGAFVTWGYLRHPSFLDERDVVEIQRLVTVGSLVGNAELRELLFSDTAAVSLPRGVRSWINAVNADDPFAWRLTATDATSGQARALRGIDDVVTGSADEPAHDLRGYLRDAGTARAIVGAWCDAADARRRFAGCLALARR